METIKKVIFAIFILLALVGSFQLGRVTASPSSCRPDTLVVTKTVKEYMPAPKSKSLVKWQPLPKMIFCSDTLSVQDTITLKVRDTIYLPITQNYYERLDGRLRLWVSGYQPSLDKWELDEQTKIVNNRKHWGFSIGVGPAVIYSPFHNNVDAGVGVFGGFTYTF